MGVSGGDRECQVGVKKIEKVSRSRYIVTSRAMIQPDSAIGLNRKYSEDLDLQAWEEGVAFC